IASVVERLELAGLGIDDLDASGPVIIRLRDRKQLARTFHELEAAVVGYVDLPTWPHRRAVRAAAERGDDVDLAVGRHARQRAPLDLHEDDRAIRHRHRSFGEAQAGGDLPD